MHPTIARLKRTARYTWQWRGYQRQARAWLRANDDRLVADVLFKLNHTARYTYGGQQDLIYRLKTRVLQVFCEKGYLTYSTLQKQTQECWDCGGTGKDWGHICEKCDGTGIYRQHELIYFVFEIGGTTYRWHQPKRLVTWHVPLAWQGYGAEMTPREDGTPPDMVEGETLIALHCCLLHAYLKQRGVHVALPYDGVLWREFRTEWRTLWAPRVRRWKRAARNTVRRWLDLPEVHEQPEDLPF